MPEKLASWRQVHIEPGLIGLAVVMIPATGGNHGRQMGTYRPRTLAGVPKKYTKSPSQVFRLSGPDGPHRCPASSVENNNGSEPAATKYLSYLSPSALSKRGMIRYHRGLRRLTWAYRQKSATSPILWILNDIHSPWCWRKRSPWRKPPRIGGCRGRNPR